MTSTNKRATNPWADIDAALEAWSRKRVKLDASLTKLIGRPRTRDGEQVSRIEVDAYGRIVARLGARGHVVARDAATLLARARERLKEDVPVAVAVREALREGEP